MRPFGRVVLAALCALTVAWPCQAEVGWMIYPYRIPAQDEDYQRLLNCPEAKYVGVQWGDGLRDDLQRQRAAELRRAGKKLIVQIWVSDWRNYNFANIALDAQMRNEFFRQCIDPFMRYWGPENMYAVHLMEETGGPFGWGDDIYGYPDAERGYNFGGVYDNPRCYVESSVLGGPYWPGLRRFNDLFRQDTGLDMRRAPIWTPAQVARFNTWVQQTMEAGAHIQFAKYVHQKYPGVRVYAFNGGPALVPQGQALDGHFIDPYTTTLPVYHRFRSYRALLRPEAELVSMVWGARNANIVGDKNRPAPRRLCQQAVCYLSGADILSFFGDRESESDEWLNVARDSVRPFIGLPRFQSRPPVLLAVGNRNYPPPAETPSLWVTGLAHYDVEYLPWICPTDVGEGLTPLQPYKLVLGWFTAHPGLDAWVRQGGILVGVHSGGDLLVKAGLLEDTGESGRLSGYQPDEWMRQHFHLQESYPLQVDPVKVYSVKDTNLVHQDQFVYVAKYGEGLLVFVPALCQVKSAWECEPHWEAYRQLLTDLCRGALLYRGEREIAEEYITDPEQGNDYMKATSSDGKITVYVLLDQLHGPHKSTTSFVVPGKDRVTGQTNVTFGEEHPVVVIER